MLWAMEQNVCVLHYSVGRTEACPGKTCAFWDRGSCALTSLRSDLPDNPNLARFLLGLRAQIEGEPQLGLADLPGLNS
jgi:hypothetical protein